MLFTNLYHQSVLLKESIQQLNIHSQGLYIDGTFGVGGHSRLILSNLSKKGRLLAMDKDLLSVEIGKIIAQQDSRFTMIHSAFSAIKNYVKSQGLIGLVDGILLDLGISTLQLNDCSRGFSFMKNGYLDMRMDINTGQSAATWLSKASKKEIFWVLRNFGEEKFAKKIAGVIISKRQKAPITNSYVLSQLISSVVSYHKRYKHPATRSFLAIRMHINRELEELKIILQDSLEILSAHGRLVVISFHSLEDRVVKCFIRKHGNIFIPSKIPLTDAQIFNRYRNKYQFKNIIKIVPSFLEISNNIRARSAILRCAEKCVI